MRLFGITAAVALLLAGTTLAQQQRQRPGGGFGGGGVSSLLQNESVQKELKLTAEQTTKVKEATDKVRADLKDDVDKLRDRNTPAEERTKINKKVDDATRKAVGGILKEDQTKRLNQIDLQQRGSRIYSDAEIQKTLKLSESQIKDIDTIAKDAAEQRTKLFQGGNPQGVQEKMTALNKETTEKIEKVLKDDQKKAVKDMLGESFAIQRPRPPQQPQRPGQPGQPGQRPGAGLPRPGTPPGPGAGQRPGAGPGQKPGAVPGQRPGAGPGQKPGQGKSPFFTPGAEKGKGAKPSADKATGKGKGPAAAKGKGGKPEATKGPANGGKFGKGKGKAPFGAKGKK
jgi:hypothetical protein